jgi:hypothetical protein
MLGPDGNGAGGMAFLSVMLATFVWGLWMTLAGAAIIAAAAQAYRGEPVDVGAAISTVAARPLSILWAAFVKGLAVGLGMFLFLVGALYFYATYFAVPTTIVVEGSSGSDGLTRSRQLAAGFRWDVLKTMALVWVLYVIIAIAVSLLTNMVFGAENVIVNNIISTVCSAFVYPLVSITEMLVYFDLRIRKEGYDVEVMAARLDPQVT